jgi:predicted transcriptional regulator
MNTPREIIEMLRQDKGMSDSKIASAVNSSQPTIWRLRNKKGDCTASTYRALLDLYDKTQQQLAQET